MKKSFWIKYLEAFLVINFKIESEQKEYFYTHYLIKFKCLKYYLFALDHLHLDQNYYSTCETLKAMYYQKKNRILLISN